MPDTTPQAALTASPAGARTRQAPPAHVSGHTRTNGTVTGPEQHHLAAGVGAILQAERTEGGWSARELAARIGAAHTTVLRIEAGTRRPSRAMLRDLARVLAMGDTRYRDRLYARLTAAAGDSLVPGTVGGERRRSRRVWRVEQDRRRLLAAEARRERERLQARPGPRAAARRTRALMNTVVRIFDRLDQLAPLLDSGQLAGPQLDAAEAEYDRARAQLDALMSEPTKPPRDKPHA